MITLTANDVSDAANQLGIRRNTSGVTVRWRHDYYNNMNGLGCVVEIGDISKNEYEDIEQAILVISKYLRDHDEWVKAGCQPYVKIVNPIKGTL